MPGCNNTAPDHHRLTQAQQPIGNVATGQSECIDAWIVDDEKRETVVAFIGLCRDAVTDVVYVLGDLRVFDELAALANAAHDRAANLRLLRLVEDRIGRAAHVRDPDVVRTGAADENDSRDSEQRQNAFGEINDQCKISKLQGHTSRTPGISVCSTF